MNLGDPELELIDPTPNIHLLFVHFDKLFFWTKLSNRAVVRWSKRMYSCAGVCSYEGRGGLCDIALSEPLLKLRPRKDLVETLLHEMIHAYLFITNNDKDRDGHGPNFQLHMRRINQFAGLNISIYHSFHEEVELYQTHWWRCDGPCQKWKPYFGICRRSMNKAPGPSDSWWNYHQKKCGGTFVKIKEPEKPVKKTTKAKPYADITKYINNNNNIPKTNVLRDSNNKPYLGIKSNNSSTVITTKKGNVSFNPKVSKPINPPVLFSGNGNILNGNRNKSQSVDAAETVRNVWANKQLPSTSGKEIMKVDGRVIGGKNLNPNKHKVDSVHLDSPPMKIKKIDDYFKTNASTILKDVYGGDFKITQLDNNKLKAVCTKVEQAVSTKVELKDLVDCPVCSLKVNSNEINRHLDECLNKDVIAQMSRNNEETIAIKNNDVFHSKEEAENEIKRLENEIRLKGEHLNKDVSKKTVSDNCIDLTGYMIPPTRGPLLKMNYNQIKIDLNAYLEKEREDINNAPHVPDLILLDKSIFDMEDVMPVVKYIRRKYEILEASKTKNANIIKVEPSAKTDILDNIKIKEEPVNGIETIDLICPCCGKIVQKPVAEHLDICISFFNNNTTIPGEGTSSNYKEETIVIEDDDDDIFDETQTLNATGTKSPCPCCLEMIEEAIMNEHLNTCLS